MFVQVLILIITLLTGPPSEKAQVLSDYVQQVIVDSNMLDMTQLSIEPGIHCWILYCDVLCCNYDGKQNFAYTLSFQGIINMNRN